MHNNHPLVSLIIPVYNGERYLAEALESVSVQDYAPLEIIVVDDGSTDQSAQIAQSYSMATYIYQVQQGVAIARNTGLAAASGEFITFLDSDDIMLPKSISYRLTYLLQHPKLGCVLARYNNFVEPGMPLPNHLRAKSFSDDLYWHLGTMMAHKSVFEKVGCFNPELSIGEDTDWFTRLKHTQIPMAKLPEIMMRRRFHRHNTTRRVKESQAALLKITRAAIGRQVKRPRNAN